MRDVISYSLARQSPSTAFELIDVTMVMSVCPTTARDNSARRNAMADCSETGRIIAPISLPQPQPWNTGTSSESDPPLNGHGDIYFPLWTLVVTIMHMVWACIISAMLARSRHERHHQGPWPRFHRISRVRETLLVTSVG